MYTVYGIKNCDTVKKALRWLEENKIEFVFHDFKSKGVSDEALKKWCKQIGWENMVNKKGLTWKQLSSGRQEQVKNQTEAILLMKEKTSVIKRPVVENLKGEVVVVGFSEADFHIKFNRK